MKPIRRACGLTLLELVSALLILSLLALMSYRGLGAARCSMEVTAKSER